MPDASHVILENFLLIRVGNIPKTINQDRFQKIPSNKLYFHSVILNFLVSLIVHIKQADISR